LASELRWILAAIGVPLLLGIWWWGTRRSRQASGNAVLRESGSAPAPASGAARHAGMLAGSDDPERHSAPRTWGVPPFEPLSIRTADFDAQHRVDLPMTAHAEPFVGDLELGAAGPQLAAGEAMADLDHLDSMVATPAPAVDQPAPAAYPSQAENFQPAANRRLSAAHPAPATHQAAPLANAATAANHGARTGSFVPVADQPARLANTAPAVDSAAPATDSAFTSTPSLRSSAVAASAPAAGVPAAGVPAAGVPAAGAPAACAPAAGVPAAGAPAACAPAACAPAAGVPAAGVPAAGAAAASAPAVGVPAVGTPAAPRSPAASANPPAPTVSEPQRIVSVRVSALSDGRWPGSELKAALEDHGLSYGRYHVFHRRHSDGRSLFCAASLVEPGTFNAERMPMEEFRGLTLFAVLPGPGEPLQTVDALIRTAAELAQTLHGVVQDSQGVPLSQQRAAALREDVARFQALSMH
jgi:hypothetical protein